MWPVLPRLRVDEREESVRDGVTGAAGRSGESIRDFEMQKEEKGRSCWVIQVFWCSQFQL